MSTADYQRPAKLYRYSERRWLERSLTLGEFRLRPAADYQDMVGDTPGKIMPLKAGTVHAGAAANYLTLCFTQCWDEQLFDTFSGADTCLIIHNVEEFGERLHRAVERTLPHWAGIDAAIHYGVRSPLGAAFTKAGRYASQKEWRFAWRPTQPTMALSPIVVQLGNIESLAELREKSR